MVEDALRVEARLQAPVDREQRGRQRREDRRRIRTVPERGGTAGTALDPTVAARWWTGLKDHTHPFLAAREPLWRVSVAATAPLLGLPGTKVVEWAGALRWLRTLSLIHI